MCLENIYEMAEADIFPLPPTRSYKKTMKATTRRKLTSSTRINLNRFWNELEEFYDRYEERKENNNNNRVVLPDWSRDNTDREEAENRMNESIECDREVEQVFHADFNIKMKSYQNFSHNYYQPQTRARLDSSDYIEADFDSDEEDEEQYEEFPCCCTSYTSYNLPCSFPQPPSAPASTTSHYPHPPSVHQTVALLELVQKMNNSRLSTQV